MMQNDFLRPAVRRFARGTACLSVILPLMAASAHAQRVYTANDYKQAERWLSYNTRPLVSHTVSNVSFLGDGRVFYRDSQAAGVTYMIADPKKGTKAPAFDRDALASALMAATRLALTGATLNVSSYEPVADGFRVTTNEGTFSCDRFVDVCSKVPVPTPFVRGQDSQVKAQTPATPPAGARRGRRGREPVNVSPDGRLAAFVRENNLWVRDLSSGEEHALTTDGIEDYGYATDNAGWQHSDQAIVTWSADAKKVATFRLDQRKTGMMYLVPVTNRHPKLEAWHYPLVGDADVTMIEPVVIDVASGAMTKLKIEPLQHRSMECDDISCDGDGKWSDVDFSPDDTKLAFVSTSRDHKDEWVKVADTATGDVRDVYHEHVDTYYGNEAKTDWKVLWDSNEFVWASERKDWAQYYLYDLNSGKLKGEITHGEGPVAEIVAYNSKLHTLYFTAYGKAKTENPYYRKLYSVKLDGKDQTLLTPEDLDHAITASPDGSHFVDVYSSLDHAQTTVLRDAAGKVMLELAKQDISALTTAGWKPPMPIKVKAADGKTEVYGYAWRPTNFDPAKKYPVVDVIYPGPQGGSVMVHGALGFAASLGDDQALADLGFVVVSIEGMGNPFRSKSFHDYHASKPEDMGEDTVPDQVAGLKELAQQYPWIDLDHVGIWGHSGGGNATASALFHFPDFFKVGWSESGNHDNRDYEDDWDERWAGLEFIGPDGKSNYDPQANQNFAANLKGKLMLVHGSMDDNVPPNNTLLLVDALMKANKNFDLLIVPNVPHGYQAMGPYIMRRRWDYFVQNLGGGTPPTDFTMTPLAQTMRAAFGPDVEEDQP